jgi:hypothetical protein
MSEDPKQDAFSRLSKIKSFASSKAQAFGQTLSKVVKPPPAGNSAPPPKLGPTGLSIGQSVGQALSKVVRPPLPGNYAAQEKTAKELTEKVNLALDKGAELSGKMKVKIESAAAATADASAEMVEAVKVSLEKVFPKKEDPSLDVFNGPFKVPYGNEEANARLLEKNRAAVLVKIQVLGKIKQDLARVNTYQEFLKVYVDPTITTDIKILLNLEELKTSLQKMNERMLLSQRGFLKARDKLVEIEREQQYLSGAQVELEAKEEELNKLFNEDLKQQKLQSEGDGSPFLDVTLQEKQEKVRESLSQTIEKLRKQLKGLKQLSLLKKEMEDMQKNTPRLSELYILAFRRIILCAIRDPECEPVKQKLESMLRELPHLRSSMYGGKIRRTYKKIRLRKLYR